MTTTTARTIALMGTLEHIDPNLIVVEVNVRTEAHLPREFVASIKQNGVLTPILARRDTQGTVIVRAGQRRTLAAREAGLVTIPAYGGRNLSHRSPGRHSLPGVPVTETAAQPQHTSPERNGGAAAITSTQAEPLCGAV